MSKSKLENSILNSIYTEYVVNGKTLDQVAKMNGVARSSMTNYILKNIGRGKFEAWKDERKRLHSTATTKKAEKVAPEKKATKQKAPFQYIYIKKPTVTQFSVIVDDESYQVTVSNGEKAEKLIKALESGDKSTVLEFCNLKEAVAKESNNEIQFDKLSKDFNIAGISLPAKFKSILVNCYKSDEGSVLGLVNFIKILNKAGKLHLLDQLYEFLKHNDIQILPSGKIAGYKYLRLSNIHNKFVDDYTASIIQDVGYVVEMDESDVDSNPDRTCSHGLHVGSWEYVKNRAYIARVIVSPEDVVSIPADYDGMKMRCKKYLIAEIRSRVLGNPIQKRDFKDLSRYEPQQTGYVYLNKEV